MHTYIYIPGFGDRSDPLRRLALQRWKSATTNAIFVPMHWTNKVETYEEKYQRIAQAIKLAKDDEITLVGESAGGAMALLAFSRHPEQIHHVVTVCGYNHGAKDVHQIHKQKHPAFYKLMPPVDRVIGDLTPERRRRITTIYSTRDSVVTPEHSRVAGAQQTVLDTTGHFSNIARVLIRKLPLK